VCAAAVSDEVDLLQGLLDVGTGGTVPDEHPGQEEKNVVRMRRVVNLIRRRGLLRCKAVIWHQDNALSAFCDPSSQVGVIAFVLSAVKKAVSATSGTEGGG
jgi:hypothetical protein